MQIFDIVIICQVVKKQSILNKTRNLKINHTKKINYIQEKR